MSDLQRIEELTLKLLDKQLTEAELAELEALVSGDPAAERAHLALLEQEASLRGERVDFGDLAARIRKGVLGKVHREAGLPNLDPGWNLPLGRWALAASLLLAVAVAWALAGLWQPTPPPHEAFLIGQSVLLPGQPATYRALVRDAVAQTPEAAVPVVFALYQGDAQIWQVAASTDARGVAEVQATLPADAALGNYTLKLVASTSLGDTEVAHNLVLQRNVRLLLTSDKPIYRPGGLIHLRAMALSSFDLKPAADEALLFEVRDGKGNKVFEAEVQTSSYGIASADFRLADQVNLGSYELSARLGNTTSERTVEVRSYVLPKFRLELNTTQGYYAPGQLLQGQVHAEYLFGKPVRDGQVVIEAWEPALDDGPFARFQGVTDAEGMLAFELPLKDAFVGLQARGQDALLSLRAQVSDAAGQSQETVLDLPVSNQTLRVELFPESGSLVLGVENRVFVVAAYPDGRPAQALVQISGLPEPVQTSEAGLGECLLTPQAEEVTLAVRADDQSGHSYQGAQTLSGAAGDALLLRSDRALYRVGDSLHVHVLSARGVGKVFLDVVKGGHTLSSASLVLEDGRGQHVLDLAPDMFGSLELHAYRILPDGTISGDARLVQVMPADALRIEARLDKESYRPAETALLKLAVTNSAGDPVQAALGLVGVDEAVFALQDLRPGLLRIYFMLREQLLQPRYQIHSHASHTARAALSAPSRPDAGGEAASAVLLAAAGAAHQPSVWEGASFDARLRRHQRELRRASSRLFAVGGLGLGAFVVGFVLLLFGYAIYRLRAQPLGEDAALRRCLRWLNGWWLLGIYLPLGGMIATGLLVETLRIPYRTREPLVVGVGIVLVVLCATMLASGAARLRRQANAARLPLFRRLMSGLAPMYLLLVAGMILLGLSGSRSPRWLNEGQIVFSWVGLLAAAGLGFASLGAAGRALLRQTSLAGWLGSLGLRSLAMASPFVLLGMFTMTMTGSMRAPGQDAGAALEWEPTDGIQAMEASGGPRVRRNFPETLLWLPQLITGEDGRAEVEIPLADNITSWRLSLDAVSAHGALGATQLPLTVFQPFFVDFDLPVALTQNDRVEIPIAVYNYLPRAQTVRLELELPDAFALEGSASQEIVLEADQVARASFTLRALRPGQHNLLLRAFGGELSDAIERSLQVLPDGREVVQTLNGELLDNRQLQVEVPQDAIDGSLDMYLKIYPGAFSQVLEGLENIFRMPHGCFEQTSSATYPNILVLDYLQRTGQDRPEIALKALEYINLGYQRLVSFEAPGGGFDWFGNPPGHPVLTAYGLMEFSDMARVHPVDPDVIARTRRWLLKQQDSDGSWQASRTGIVEGAVNSTQGDTERTTAYIAWALASSNRGQPADERVQRALDYLMARLKPTSNTYSLALLANALVAQQDPRAAQVLQWLGARATRDGTRAYWTSEGEGATHSRGSVLDIETTALAAYALVQGTQALELSHAALRWLIEQKDPQGTWHSTQATVHSLRALLAASDPADDSGETLFVTVAVNGEAAAELEIAPASRDVLRLVSLRGRLRAGSNQIALESAGGGSLSYQLVASHYLPWAERAPAPAPEQALSITVQYDSSELPASDLLGCQVDVRWNHAAPAAMVMLDLGIPPGFELLPEAFTQLQAEGVIEKFQLTGRQAILYLRGLRQDKPLRFRYQLRALYPVKVKTPRSEAWLYYQPEVRGQAEPVELRVF